MILGDANLVLYAYDSTSSWHAAARQWLESVLSGESPVRFALFTLLVFVRLSTNPAVFAQPYQAGEAIAIVTSWLGQPCVGLPNRRRVTGPCSRRSRLLARRKDRW